jgi:hypothetical protein
VNEDENQAKTPMSDHVRWFWWLLRHEHVYITINIRRSHEADSDVQYHWDAANFGDDVAKALARENDLVELLQLSDLRPAPIPVQEKGESEP